MEIKSVKTIGGKEVFKVVNIELDKYSAIVFSCRYISHIYYLNKIEEQLGIDNGLILFDGLTAKGNVSNRFVEARVVNGKIDKKTLKVVNVEHQSEIRKYSSEFYRKSGLDLIHSMLQQFQVELILNGHIL